MSGQTACGATQDAKGALPRESPTASVSASILEYRRVQGRTYHADKFVNDYAFPNDDQQLESIDISYDRASRDWLHHANFMPSHHSLTLLLDGQLFLAPIKDNVQVRACSKHWKKKALTLIIMILSEST